jgi:hypothetical protein
MQLGTYSTIDCPTQKMDEAYVWLQTEFEKIGGMVRKIMNPHDFGEYPSFEIDYPAKLEFIDSDEEYDDEDDQKLAQEKDEWHDKANAIEAEYNKRFSEYL